MTKRPKIDPAIIDAQFEPDKASRAILEDPELFNRLVSEVEKKVVGEIPTVKAVLLACAGRLVKNCQIASFNLLVNSISGAGKDYVVTNVIKVLPPLQYTIRSRISATTFTYWHNAKYEPNWTWDGQVFYCEDISESVLNSSVFKVMCSSGSFATVVINQMAIDIQIKGKPVIIITTANSVPNPELIRRFNIINLNEAKQQSQDIMDRMINSVKIEGCGEDYDEALIKAQGYLRMVNVFIPFADKLKDYFPADNVMCRTIFPRFLDYIKASAALHQFTRRKTENGWIEAAEADFELAKDVFESMNTNTFRIPLTNDQKKIMQTFSDLATGKIEIKKYVCPSCKIICEEPRCQRCYEWSPSGHKIYQPAELLPQQEFTAYDLLEHVQELSIEYRQLIRNLDRLTSYQLLKRGQQKRDSSRKSYMTFSILGWAYNPISKSFHIVKNQNCQTDMTNLGDQRRDNNCHPKSCQADSSQIDLKTEPQQISDTSFINQFSKSELLATTDMTNIDIDINMTNMTNRKEKKDNNTKSMTIIKEEEEEVIESKPETILNYIKKQPNCQISTLDFCSNFDVEMIEKLMKIGDLYWVKPGVIGILR